MTTQTDFNLTEDFVIVGTGAAGLFTALSLLEEGHSVCMIDGGQRQSTDFSIYNEKEKLNFSNLFNDIKLAKKLLVDEDLLDKNFKFRRVGSQLTPPRKYITDLAEKVLDIESENFFPLHSLAVGGLTQGWGAACVQFTKDELAKCGFEDDASKIYQAYDTVSEQIGISSDVYKNCLPVAEIDDLYKAILKRSQKIKVLDFQLQKATLALLTKNFDQRKKNDLSNLDFYLDKGQSVFRGSQYLESLKSKYRKLNVMHGYIVESYQDEKENVLLVCKSVVDQKKTLLKVKKLILCAGAINSGRIYLKNKITNKKTLPIVSSPYFYYACSFLRRFGISNSERKHSLTQLIGTLKTNDNESLLQFYSYDSMMLFKLVKDIDLPYEYSYRILQYIIDSVSIVGHFLPEELYRAGQMMFVNDKFVIDYKQDLTDQQQDQINHAKAVLKKLGLIVLKQQNTGPAGSIHYAGTLAHLGFKLEKNVFCTDSSVWNFMPGKSPTWTIMASAYVLTKKILNEVKKSS